ncbi:hypothetical protein H8959_020027 [Pygathrix nigripes]
MSSRLLSAVARTVPRRQVSRILNVRSRSGDTNGSSVTRRALKRQASCVVVIDSDSDDECYTYEEKKAKLLEINSDGKIHPELPKVTRCHNYKINYKVHYECTGCKTRIGRYTKSLDTSRFICGKCEGSLVMVPLTQKHGTRIVPHV